MESDMPAQNDTVFMAGLHQQESLMGSPSKEGLEWSWPLLHVPFRP